MPALQSVGQQTCSDYLLSIPMANFEGLDGCVQPSANVSLESHTATKNKKGDIPVILTSVLLAIPIRCYTQSVLKIKDNS